MQNSNLSTKVEGNCIVRTIGNTGPKSNGTNVYIQPQNTEQTFFIIGLVPNDAGHCSNIGLTNASVFEFSIADKKINPSYTNGIIKLTNRLDWEYFTVLSSSNFALYIS